MLAKLKKLVFYRQFLTTGNDRKLSYLYNILKYNNLKLNVLEMNEITQKEKRTSTHNKQLNIFIYTVCKLGKMKNNSVFNTALYRGTGPPTEPKACLSVQIRNYF